jgi:hypothetical protein
LSFMWQSAPLTDTNDNHNHNHILWYYIIICQLLLYRVGHEKVARLLFWTCPYYCINFCIYAMLQTPATFLWPTLYI